MVDKDNGCILGNIMVDKGLKRPTPDKVFRAGKLNGESVLVPASNAIGMVLCHSIKKEPSLDELINFICKR